MDNITQAQGSIAVVGDRLQTRCRAERIESSASGRNDRIVRSASSRGEEPLFERVDELVAPLIVATPPALAAVVRLG